MRKTTFVITIIMAIFAIFTTNASAATTIPELVETNVAYDMNGDGVTNAMDLTIMKTLVINEDSRYKIADIVKLKKLILEAYETETEIGKAARGYNFKTIKPSEENVNFIRNSLCNSELISIKYNSGTFILEDENTETYLYFKETTENPPEGDDIVIEFSIEGKTYVVWTENESFKVAEKHDIGKAAIGYDFKTIKPSDESINFIRNSLCNCELISIKYEAGTFILEDEYTVTYLQFEETIESTEKEGDNVVIAFPLDDGSVKVIYVDEFGKFAVSESK